MILVVASSRDPGAAALVDGWAGARLLTPADLSLPGWVVPSGPDADTATVRGVADGEPFVGQQVDAVLTLVSAVDPDELVWITPDHREYVAGEMTAFLGHWLTTLADRCVVEPSHGSLAGPSPSVGVWARAAGLALADPTELGDDRRRAGGLRVVTVVGDRVFRLVAGRAREARGLLADRMRAMAARLDVAVVSVVVHDGATGPERLVSVLPAPIVGPLAVRAAVRELVDERVFGDGLAAALVERVAS